VALFVLGLCTSLGWGSPLVSSGGARGAVLCVLYLGVVWGCFVFMVFFIFFF